MAVLAFSAHSHVQHNPEAFPGVKATFRTLYRYVFILAINTHPRYQASRNAENPLSGVEQH